MCVLILDYADDPVAHVAGKIRDAVAQKQNSYLGGLVLNPRYKENKYIYKKTF